MQDLATFSNRTKMLVVLLWICIALQIPAIGVDINQLRVLIAIQNAAGDAAAIDTLGPQGTISDQLMSLMGYCQIGIFIITGILFLAWIHQANKNARAFGAQNMKFTPGWAVGWYFIPVASLFMPFKVMSEIFRASAKPEGWENEQNPAVLAPWWFFWLADNIVEQITNRVNGWSDEISSLIGATYLQVFSDVLSIPNYYVAMLLVKQLHAIQQETYARVGFVAAPPPVIDPAATPET